MSESENTVLVVGAGLAGLACASELKHLGYQPLVVDRAVMPGGRLRTERKDGFALDQGFQVLLTSYPEAGAILDYAALRLGTFQPGAYLQLSRRAGCAIGDPLREPAMAASTLIAPIGNLRDKLLILKLRRLLRNGPPPAEGAWIRQSARDWLAEFGFSERMIRVFFRPFFTGVFLEPNLDTSAWMLAYTYSYFSRGLAALPRGGIDAIPQQLAARIGPDHFLLGREVREIRRTGITLEDGTRLDGCAVVLAVDGPSLAKMEGGEAREEYPMRTFRSTRCHYFKSRTRPLKQDRLIWLNSTGEGLITQIALPSSVASGYAPEGWHLISVGTLGQGDLTAERTQVENELERFFPEAGEQWEWLDTVTVANALPDASPAGLAGAVRHPRRWRGAFVAGDHLHVGSIDAALSSGRKAAQCVRAELREGGAASAIPEGAYRQR